MPHALAGIANDSLFAISHPRQSTLAFMETSLMSDNREQLCVRVTTGTVPLLMCRLSFQHAILNRCWTYVSCLNTYYKHLVCLKTSLIDFHFRRTISLQIKAHVGAGRLA